MRRGRPAGPAQQPPATKPSASPMRGTASDPFAALDSQDVQVRRAAADELASRFPSLDEFSLLHDRGQKFEFEQTPASSGPLNKRVTEALADDAFAVSPPSQDQPTPGTKLSSSTPSASVSRTASMKKPKPYEASASPRTSSTAIQQPVPKHSGMVSTGVQTSPAPSPVPSPYPDVSKRPIWKVPLSGQHHNRTQSQPRTFDKAQASPSLKAAEFALPARPSLDGRSRSHMSNLSIPKSPASSRPSLEGSRPSQLDIGSTIDRSRSANSNARPASMHVQSNLDFLRERESAPGRNFDAPSLIRRTTSNAIDDSDADPDARNVRSSVDFLRQIEGDPGSNQKHRRSSSQSKHARLGSLSSLTSNTKSLVKGKFGDAFRRFETNKTPEHERPEPVMSPTEPHHDYRSNHRDLTPIAGSVASLAPTEDDRGPIDETQDLPPEVRRELERRQLSEEERRVEAAAAEYKQRIASQAQGKPRAPSKASTIQNRVKNLLDESNKSAPVNRTAAGYGKYTDTGKPLPVRPSDQSDNRPPPVARKPVNVGGQQDLAYAKPSGRPNMPPPAPSSSAPPAINVRAPSGPPPPAPKPKALQTGGSANPPSAQGSPTKPASIRGVNRREKPLPAIAGDAPGGEEWDVDAFSKRYPSLSGLEMVETEIPKRSVRDV